MQWVSGVARLFIEIQGQMVQVDLLPTGAQGFIKIDNLQSAVEPLRLSSTTQCMFLRVGPLVTAKIKAHYGREMLKDYQDLRFVCKSTSYAPLVKDAANTFRREWKESFLSQLIQNHPQDEGQVRWALNMDSSPSSDGNDSGGGGGGGGVAGGTPVI